MEMQSEFFLHITGGVAGDAAPLMARIALHLGHDPKAFPVSLSEILSIGECARDPDTSGFNELLVADYLRSAMLSGNEAWDEEEVRQLKRVAGVACRAPIHLISG